MSAGRTAAVPTPARPAVRWGSWAWLAVIAIIGVVQLIRRQEGDALIFGGAALIIAADLLGLLRFAARWPRPRPALLLAIAAVLVLPVALLPRHGAALGVLLALIGAAVLVAAWPNARGAPPAAWPTALRRLAAAWAAIWILGGLWELAQVLLVEAGAVGAPLSDLLDPALHTLPGRAAFAVGWLAVGAWLLRRGAAPR